MTSFTDRHGGCYYQYRERTERFPAGTDFVTAHRRIGEWLRSGPDGEDPEPWTALR